MSKTADLCDANASVRVLAPGFTSFGGRKAFCGRIATVRVKDDNVLVRRVLGEEGAGRVLIVDGQASLNCALAGDCLAKLAHEHHWAGLIINGCIRDSAELSTIELGIHALARHPRRSRKEGAGERGRPVTFGGVTFHEGEFVYADPDGVVVSERSLAPSTA